MLGDSALSEFSISASDESLLTGVGALLMTAGVEPAYKVDDMDVEATFEVTRLGVND